MATLTPAQNEKFLQFLDCKEQSGRTALFVAAEAGRVKVAGVLLRYKASTEAKNDNGVTPLGVACEHGHVPMIKLLIENEARCDVKVGDKKLFELIATSVKDVKLRCEVARALLANGAIATDDELQKIRESLAAEHREIWDTAIAAAREERAKNFTKAIGDDAPVPTSNMQDAPMDEISKFLSFDQPLFKNQ